MTFCSLLLAVWAVGSTAPAEFPVQLKLGPDGEILGWLASGPFPNVGALEMRGKGFATDYLAGEAGAVAAEGQRIPMIPEEQAADPALIIRRGPDWILGLGTAMEGVDLDRLLNGSKPAVAYLYTTLISPNDRNAEILFGSDDGAKVYVNGELLFQKQIARGIKRDEDRVPIHLRAGPNRVLFKIEQGDGGWGLLARVADLQGHGLKDVEERIDVRKGPTNRRDALGERWIRAASGKPGTLDVGSAVRYDLVSAKARYWVQSFRSEADDPQKLLSVIADWSNRVGTESDATTLSRDLGVGGAEIQREYDRTRLPLLRETQIGLPLVRTDVRKEDYVKVMPGGRYFIHADGRTLIPIGYNHNPDWPEFEESNPDQAVYRPDETYQYMAHLKEKGVNVIRLMVETPPTGNLEEPLGTFSPEHVRWLDTIFSAARKNGIKLIVTPWDTFWMNLRFDKTPYNPALGGPLGRKIEFITSDVLRKVEKRRLKYLIDRWGNSGTVFSWELLNEADLWWGATPEQLHGWIDDMAGYVRGYERQKWGRNHLLSVSFSVPMPKGELAEDAYRLPDLDYATTHLYIGASRAPTEPVGPALTAQTGVVYSLGQITDRRPYMDTENGPIDKWIDSEALDDQVFQGMIWAHLASGAAGSGFRWPYRHPHHLTEGMLTSLSFMSLFVEGVDWRALAGERVTVEVQGSGATCGFGTRESAMVWSSAGGAVTLKWPGGPSAVTAKVFDCASGKWVEGAVKRVPGGFVVSASQSFAAVLSASKS